MGHVWFWQQRLRNCKLSTLPEIPLLFGRGVDSYVLQTDLCLKWLRAMGKQEQQQQKVKSSAPLDHHMRKLFPRGETSSHSWTKAGMLVAAHIWASSLLIHKRYDQKIVWREQQWRCETSLHTWGARDHIFLSVLPQGVWGNTGTFQFCRTAFVRVLPWVQMEQALLMTDDCINNQYYRLHKELYCTIVLHFCHALGSNENNLFFHAVYNIYNADHF